MSRLLGRAGDRMVRMLVPKVQAQACVVRQVDCCDFCVCYFCCDANCWCAQCQCSRC